MNFLSLVQRLAQEAGSGLAGSITTTASATGELLRLSNWITQSWNDIQTKHDDWEWMRSSVLNGGGISFATVAAQYNYKFGTSAGQIGIPLASFGKWQEGSFRCNTTAIGFLDELDLWCINYDAWRESYMFGAMRNVQTRPVVITIAPDKSLSLGPPPNGNYTITGDYYVAPTAISQDSDVPAGIPPQWHLIIVFYAMCKLYAGYENAPDVAAEGQPLYDKMMSEMEVNYTPRMRMGGALA